MSAMLKPIMSIISNDDFNQAYRVGSLNTFDNTKLLIYANNSTF